MAISQHGPQNKLTKLYNYGHKISKRFTQTDHSSNKAHTLAIKLAIYSDICKLLSFSLTSLVLITVVSLANLHKRPETLARYYVTSDLQAEWDMKVENNRVTFPPRFQPFVVAFHGQSSTFYTGSLFRNETAITMGRKAFFKSDRCTTQSDEKGTKTRRTGTLRSRVLVYYGRG